METTRIHGVLVEKKRHIALYPITSNRINPILQSGLSPHIKSDENFSSLVSSVTHHIF
jgi:hypothetical protein